MSIGERIVEERKRLGLTQAAFAQKLGVSLSSQKRYETNERLPSLHYFNDLAGIGVEADYVITGARTTSEQISFYARFDSEATKRLALTILDLDMEGFADAASVIFTTAEGTPSYRTALLDALINNSPPLQQRIKALKKARSKDRGS